MKTAVLFFVFFLGAIDILASYVGTIRNQYRFVRISINQRIAWKVGFSFYVAHITSSSIWWDLRFVIPDVFEGKTHPQCFKHLPQETAGPVKGFLTTILP